MPMTTCRDLRRLVKAEQARLTHLQKALVDTNQMFERIEKQQRQDYKKFKDVQFGLDLTATLTVGLVNLAATAVGGVKKLGKELAKHNKKFAKEALELFGTTVADIYGQATTDYSPAPPSGKNAAGKMAKNTIGTQKDLIFDAMIGEKLGAGKSFKKIAVDPIAIVIQHRSTQPDNAIPSAIAFTADVILRWSEPSFWAEWITEVNPEKVQREVMVQIQTNRRKCVGLLEGKIKKSRKNLAKLQASGCVLSDLEMILC